MRKNLCQDTSTGECMSWVYFHAHYNRSSTVILFSLVSATKTSYPLCSNISAFQPLSFSFWVVTLLLKQNLEFESFNKTIQPVWLFLQPSETNKQKTNKQKLFADPFSFVAVQNRPPDLLAKGRCECQVQDLMSLGCSVCTLVSLRTCMTLPSQATSPRPPSTSAASSRRKIQVTGTSVTPAASKCERHPCHPFLVTLVFRLSC